MASIISTLETLLPIILGGVIGFLASFATSHFGHSRTQDALVEERTRERLEELYRALIQIDKMASAQYGEAVSYVHFAKKIEEREIPEFPPHSKLKMLIGLYFKDFTPLLKELSDAQEKFSLKYIDMVTKDFSSKSKDERKSICTDLTKLNITLDQRIKDMKDRVSEEIKI